ncbi:MAG TPA: substrate-binding domain-containing protein, partial [Tepidisphaeraceae bacterium]|nr:substrate-binding domain-containing protein [Tepidisphaeraceae bacterium]
MPPNAPSSLALIAGRLEGDIRSRSLRAGDRYLSVADAATMIGVSTATANRAMDILVQKRLLVRQQGRGTFVGEAAGAPSASRVRTVFVLLMEDQEGVGPYALVEAFIPAIRHRMGNVNLQVSFIPARRSIDYLSELIVTAQKSGQLAGVVPISCPREIYRYLDDSGVPTVVVGSLCPDQQHIASLDSDSHAIGSLLARHLVSKGHRRMGLIVTGEGRPGDHAFFDGISNELTAADLPHNALTVRIFPRDFDAFRAQVFELLSQPERPTGIICSIARLVGPVQSIADELGLRVPQDLDVVFHGVPNNPREAS